MNLVPLENPPDVLTAKSRDILRNLGYTDRAVDSTADFFGDGGIVNFARSKGHNMDEWGRLFSQSPSAIGYWYRQSPAPMVVESTSSNGRATIADPPVTLPGMRTVVMDLDGSLRRFAAVPPEHEAAPVEVKPPDWARLFAAANLDPAKFTSVAPEWSSSVMSDTRAAWTGLYKDRADLPVRIEAASFHNRPVYFQVLWPWTAAVRLAGAQQLPHPSQRRQLCDRSHGLHRCLVDCPLQLEGRPRGPSRRYAGWYFLRCDEPDRWIFHAHHVASDAEQTLIGNALANAAYVCLEYWLIYLALEPWVRRYWPQTMITWSRVVAGKWTDPSWAGICCSDVFRYRLRAHHCAVRICQPSLRLAS